MGAARRACGKAVCRALLLPEQSPSVMGNHRAFLSTISRSVVFDACSHAVPSPHAAWAQRVARGRCNVSLSPQLPG